MESEVQIISKNFASAKCPRQGRSAGEGGEGMIEVNGEKYSAGFDNELRYCPRCGNIMYQLNSQSPFYECLKKDCGYTEVETR